MEKRLLIDFSKVKKRRFETNVAEEIIQSIETVNVEKAVAHKSDQNELLAASKEEYDLLLDRIIEIISEKNPDMLKKQAAWSMAVPQIQRAGTRSVWINFKEICDNLKRPIDHVYNFIVKELGTEASLGGDNQLFLKGRYSSTKLESLIIKYAKEYVRCPNCKSQDTILTKNNSTRLQMLECNFCNTKRSVTRQV